MSPFQTAWDAQRAASGAADYRAAQRVVAVVWDAWSRCLPPFDQIDEIVAYGREVPREVALEIVEAALRIRAARERFH